jgi:hypothetical protein
VAFTVTLTEDDGTAIDVSGWTWRAQVRETFDAADAVMTFTVDDTDAATGVLVITLDAADWAAEASPLPTAKWRWDLEGTRTSDTFVRTYLSGKVTVKPDASRA